MDPSVTIPRVGSKRRLLVPGRTPTPDHAVRNPLPTGMPEILSATALTEPSSGTSALPASGTVINERAGYGPSGTPSLSTGNRWFTRESRIRVGLTGTYAPPCGTIEGAASTVPGVEARAGATGPISVTTAVAAAPTDAALRRLETLRGLPTRFPEPLCRDCEDGPQWLGDEPDAPATDTKNPPTSTENDRTP